MEEWKEYKLGDVCSRLSSGKNISASKISTSSIYPVYGGNGLRGYTDVSNFTGDCAIIGRQGAFCGNVRYFSGEAYMTEHAVIVCGNEKANTRYLAYLLSTMNLGRLSGQSAQPGLAVGTLSKQLINLPALPTQQKIATILSSLDDKIELNNKINENLEQQAQALFKSWFIDFEPFGGKMPENWKEASLGNICECVLGGTPSREKKEYWNGDIPWINSGEVNLFRITEPSEYITQEGLEHSSTKKLPKKTTVIAITGATLGQVSLLEIDSCTNQSVVGIIPNENLPFEYIYPMVNERIHELLSHQTGGAQQHINKQNVQSLLINLPTQEILQKYSAIVNPIYESIANNCFENKNLSAIRDSLLPKLMNGEIVI